MFLQALRMKSVSENVKWVSIEAFWPANKNDYIANQVVTVAKTTAACHVHTLYYYTIGSLVVVVKSDSLLHQ